MKSHLWDTVTDKHRKKIAWKRNSVKSLSWCHRRSTHLRWILKVTDRCTGNRRGLSIRLPPSLIRSSVVSAAFLYCQKRAPRLIVRHICTTMRQWKHHVLLHRAGLMRDPNGRETSFGCHSRRRKDFGWLMMSMPVDTASFLVLLDYSRLSETASDSRVTTSSTTQ